MYTITSSCGRRYVGTSVDPRARFAVHRRRPPAPMAGDVPDLRSWHTHFTLDNLAKDLTQGQARHLEQGCISLYSTRGPAGYNTLDATPGRSRQFWWLHRCGLL